MFYGLILAALAATASSPRVSPPPQHAVARPLHAAIASLSAQDDHIIAQNAQNASAVAGDACRGVAFAAPSIRSAGAASASRVLRYPRQSARRRPVPASTPSFRDVFHQFGAAQADDFFCILDGARDVVKPHDWYDLDSLPQAREVGLAYVIGASSNITNALLTYCVPMQIAHGLGVRSPSLLLFSVLVRVSLAEEDEPATHPRLLARMVDRVDLCGNQNFTTRSC